MRNYFKHYLKVIELKSRDRHIKQGKTTANSNRSIHVRKQYGYSHKKETTPVIPLIRVKH